MVCWPMERTTPRLYLLKGSWLSSIPSASLPLGCEEDATLWPRSWAQQPKGRQRNRLEETRDPRQLVEQNFLLTWISPPPHLWTIMQKRSKIPAYWSHCMFGSLCYSSLVWPWLIQTGSRWPYPETGALLLSPYSSWRQSHSPLEPSDHWDLERIDLIIGWEPIRMRLWVHYSSF